MSCTIEGDKCFRQKMIDELERTNRRLEDKLRTSESERIAAENARKFLEEELAKLQACVFFVFFINELV